MTHPLTPHEKVRQIVDCALNSAIPEPWEVANHATDAIITALASGSGDHAELARLAEAGVAAAESGDLQALADSDQAFFTFFGPRVALALIAENAALREKVKFEIKLSVDNYVRATARATEAERKLAEAVELLKQALGDMDRRVITAETANRIDYFISKEAERG